MTRLESAPRAETCVLSNTTRLKSAPRAETFVLSNTTRLKSAPRAETFVLGSPVLTWSARTALSMKISMQQWSQRLLSMNAQETTFSNTAKVTSALRAETFFLGLLTKSIQFVLFCALIFSQPELLLLGCVKKLARLARRGMEKVTFFLQYFSMKGVQSSKVDEACSTRRQRRLSALKVRKQMNTMASLRLVRLRFAPTASCSRSSGPIL